MGRLEGPNREVREVFQPQSTKIKWRRAPRKVKLVLSDLEGEIKTLKSYIGIELQVLAVVGPLKLMKSVNSEASVRLDSGQLSRLLGAIRLSNLPVNLEARLDELRDGDTNTRASEDQTRHLKELQTLLYENSEKLQASLEMDREVLEQRRAGEKARDATLEARLDKIAAAVDHEAETVIPTNVDNRLKNVRNE